MTDHKCKKNNENCFIIVGFSCTWNVDLNGSCNSAVHAHWNWEKIKIPHVHSPGFLNAYLPSYANEPTL